MIWARTKIGLWVKNTAGWMVWGWTYWTAEGGRRMAEGAVHKQYGFHIRSSLAPWDWRSKHPGRYGNCLLLPILTCLHTGIIPKSKAHCLSSTPLHFQENSIPAWTRRKERGLKLFPRELRAHIETMCCYLSTSRRKGERRRAWTLVSGSLGIPYHISCSKMILLTVYVCFGGASE